MEDRNFLFHAEKYLLTFLARGYLRYMQTTVVLDVRSPRATDATCDKGQAYLSFSFRQELC